MQGTKKKIFGFWPFFAYLFSAAVIWLGGDVIWFSFTRVFYPSSNQPHFSPQLLLLVTFLGAVLVVAGILGIALMGARKG